MWRREIRLIRYGAGRVEAGVRDCRRRPYVIGRHSRIGKISAGLVPDERDVRLQCRVRLDIEGKDPVAAGRRIEAGIYWNTAIDKRMLVGKVGLSVFGVQKGAVGSDKACPADRPERRFRSCSPKCERTAVRGDREPDRGTVELRGIKPIGSDLSAGVGNIERGTVADKPARTTTSRGAFVK